MRALVVLAHPNPASFNHAIAERVTTTLRDAGHEVVVRDLYAEGFRILSECTRISKGVQACFRIRGSSSSLRRELFVTAWNADTEAAASESGSVTIVEGSSFCISSERGDISSDGGTNGAFFQDTRIISHWVLRVNGVLREPLSAQRPTLR